MSGCSKGLVIHWDINSGNCINEFGLYESSVLQLEPTVSSVVGLFSEGCVRVWGVVNGDLLHTIILVSIDSMKFNTLENIYIHLSLQDGVCHDLTVLNSQHIAVSLEVCCSDRDCISKTM